jgi:hypothetical protein
MFETKRYVTQRSKNFHYLKKVFRIVTQCNIFILPSKPVLSCQGKKWDANSLNCQEIIHRPWKLVFMRMLLSQPMYSLFCGIMEKCVQSAHYVNTFKQIHLRPVHVLTSTAWCSDHEGLYKLEFNSDKQIYIHVVTSLPVMEATSRNDLETRKMFLLPQTK